MNFNFQYKFIPLILVLVTFSGTRLVSAKADCEFEDEPYPAPGIRNCTAPGVVALTFDDGPTLNGGTDEVLDVLREKGINATFFVTGTGWDTTTVDQQNKKKELIRRIFNEGHQIGSHTWTHPNLIANRTKETITNELAHIAKTVHDILGINMTVFRPPYGCSNDTVVEQVESEFGYKVVQWNLDTKDWYFKRNVNASFSEYLFHLDNEISTKSSYIALHHDPAPGSAELARKVIDYVTDKGFTFVTVGECIGVPNFI